MDGYGTFYGRQYILNVWTGAGALRLAPFGRPLYGLILSEILRLSSPQLVGFREITAKVSGCLTKYPRLLGSE